MNMQLPEWRTLNSSVAHRTLPSSMVTTDSQASPRTKRARVQYIPQTAQPGPPHAPQVRSRRPLVQGTDSLQCWTSRSAAPLILGGEEGGGRDRKAMTTVAEHVNSRHEAPSSRGSRNDSFLISPYLEPPCLCYTRTSSFKQYVL